VAWADARDGTGTGDIYAQRLTSGGAVSAGWSANGVKVCNAINAQQHPGVVADGAGCLLAWADDRGTSTDIYAYRSGGASSVDVPLDDPEIASFAAPFPNPTRADATLRFTTTLTGSAQVAVIDLAGRSVKRLLDESALPAGAHVLRWDGRDEAGGSAATGMYFVRFETASGTALRKLAIVR
jgi:hypothetical protein